MVMGEGAVLLVSEKVKLYCLSQTALAHKAFAVFYLPRGETSRSPLEELAVLVTLSYSYPTFK